jgi:hypothetical protein
VWQVERKLVSTGVPAPAHALSLVVICSYLAPCRTCDARHAPGAPRPSRSHVRGEIVNLCCQTTTLTGCVSEIGAFLLTISHRSQSVALGFVKTLTEQQLA